MSDANGMREAGTPVAWMRAMVSTRRPASSGSSAHRSALLSLFVHAVLALALLSLRSRAHTPEPDVEIEVVPLDPPPETARVERDVDYGTSLAATAPPREEPSPTRPASAPPVLAALPAVKDEAVVGSGAAGTTSEPAAPEQGAHACTADDCVLESLNACLAGDGNACIGVGLYYERGRGDPFSAIKWYEKGCELGSRLACTADKRVAGSMPLDWKNHAFMKPSFDATELN